LLCVLWDFSINSHTFLFLESSCPQYVDDLTFDLTQQGADCSVAAFSTSETWYAILDQGTNYCNLHNLGLATGIAFNEDTSDDICTQFSSADCEKY
jgi:hypothetical protein